MQANYPSGAYTWYHVPNYILKSKDKNFLCVIFETAVKIFRETVKTNGVFKSYFQKWTHVENAIIK